MLTWLPDLSDRLNADELNRMRDLAERLLVQNSQEEIRVEAKNALERSTYFLKSLLEDARDSDTELYHLKAMNNRIIAEMDEHPNDTKEKYDKRREEVERAINMAVLMLEKSKAPLVVSPVPVTYVLPSGSSVELPSPMGGPIPQMKSPTPNPHRVAEQNLGKYFSARLVERGSYNETDLQDIFRILDTLGSVSWSKVPRLYTVLRVIDQLQRTR